MKNFVLFFTLTFYLVSCGSSTKKSSSEKNSNKNQESEDSTSEVLNIEGNWIGKCGMISEAGKDFSARTEVKFQAGEYLHTVFKFDDKNCAINKSVEQITHGTYTVGKVYSKSGPMIEGQNLITSELSMKFYSDFDSKFVETYGLIGILNDKLYFSGETEDKNGESASDRLTEMDIERYFTRDEAN